MRKILFVGAEALPFAATGGLGDVLGSLPAEIQKCGGKDVDVRVIMPLYRAVGESFRAEMETIYEGTVFLGWRQLYVGIRMLKYNGIIYYFVDNEQYFGRGGSLYGHFDDGERFAYFCEAVLNVLPHIDFVPDVLHAHDWQAALSVVYLKLKYKSDWRYNQIRSVFTIHNIEYQGQYDPYILGGGQENNMCSGTQGMPAIAGFAAAVENCGSVEKNLKYTAKLNLRLRERIKEIPGVHINSPENALPYIINISIDEIPSQVSVNFFSMNGVYISAGSACSKGHRSNVLQSMGLPPDRIDSAIRISLSNDTSIDEIDRCADVIKIAVEKLRKHKG